MQAEATTGRGRWAAEFRTLLALAIPVVLSELGWMAMAIVDTIMVGRLSPTAIGAVGLSSAIYYAPSLFGVGILLGLDTLVSQAFGREDYDDCHRSLAQGVYLAAAFTPLLMAVIWAAPFALSRWGVNPAVEVQADAYLRILNWGTLPLLLYAAFRRYLQGIAQVRSVTFALISANLVNWAGNWALIYGKLGLPAMGVRGSALSTCVARVYMAAVLIFVAWRYERSRGHRLFAHWAGPNLQRLRQLIRLGLPTACQIALEVGAFGFATVIAGRLRPEALAAHQIALNCASVTYMVPLGISAAAAVSVGHAVGARQPARARRVGWMAIATGVVFMALAALAFLIVPIPILHVYSRDAGVLGFGVPLLALAGAFQIFDGIQTAATGALRGLGETRTPMMVNLVGYWLFGLPLGAYLCFRTTLGIYGVWLGLTLALIFIALLVLRKWGRESRRILNDSVVPRPSAAKAAT